MSMLDLVQGISKEPHNNLINIMGKPGSGKTTVAGTFPKPMLYVSIGKDGGGEVLKCYSDDDIKSLPLTSDVPGTQGAQHIQTKLMSLFNELKSTPNPYKTIVIDAFSSVEEEVVDYMEKLKGKKLNLDERGAIGTLMLNLRDTMVDLSQKDVFVLTINHVKVRPYTDSATGEAGEMIIPKMSYNNGNLLNERASAVIYMARKNVLKDDGSRAVKFTAYLGPHPCMDTKLRTNGKKLSEGLYVEDLTYEKLQKLMDGVSVEKAEVIEPNNPFDDGNDKNEDEGW